MREKFADNSLQMTAKTAKRGRPQGSPFAKRRKAKFWIEQTPEQSPPRRRSVIRFRLWRSATGNSADRSGHLPPDVITPSLKRTDDFRSDPSRQARELFNLGLVHALEYGVASADLKPPIPWPGSRFTLERMKICDEQIQEHRFCRPPECGRRCEEGPAGAGGAGEVGGREPRRRRAADRRGRRSGLARDARIAERTAAKLAAEARQAAALAAAQLAEAAAREAALKAEQEAAEVEFAERTAREARLGRRAAGRSRRPLCRP